MYSTYVHNSIQIQGLVSVYAIETGVYENYVNVFAYIVYILCPQMSIESSMRGAVANTLDVNIVGTDFAITFIF